MPSLFKNLFLKPSHVSWVSFTLLALIVVGFGLFGTAHIINYLHEQLTEHEAEHNKNIASELILRFDTTFEKDLKDESSRLRHTFEDYHAFGFRIFVLDRVRQVIIIDSEQNLDSPIFFKESWLGKATNLNSSDNFLLSGNGSALGVDENNHPVLIWLQEIGIGQPGRWVLGVARDQEAVAAFMNDLHLHMDVTMILIFTLITLLGYYALRSISRLYEIRLENQLDERTAELDKAYKEIIQNSRLATIGQTASVLTHEMRNPLASIKLALSGLKGSKQLTAREHKRVEMVTGEVDRLDGLLSETLDYVRPVQLSKNPIDLDLLLSQVLKQEEPVMSQKGVKLEHTGCSDCTAIRVDQAQFHQVLLNLIKNAIEASPEGGLIKTTLSHKDGRLLFEIVNNGTPMSEEVLQRAFEPFFTTKSKGTGLGLGLVKRVVDEHGGIVSIESNSINGTKVILSFPVISTS